jgi:hypothetical protein
MSRTIIIGDVHGCARELEDLLRYVGARRADRVVFVGDLVVRGPDPHDVVALARTFQAVAVRGNHEDRLLRWRAGELAIGGLTKEAAKQLTEADWAYLAAMPLWLDLPEHNVRVVHAGLVPGVPMSAQDPKHLLFLRSFSDSGEPILTRGARSWAHSYPGPYHVVFGHNALDEPEIAAHATGIDTGVVYGGRLTAMVLNDGERPPPPAERQSVLISVPARRVYYEKDPTRRPTRTPRS